MSERADQSPPQGQTRLTPDEVLGFARVSELLKCELRHSWLSNGRQESVADHSWHLGLLAMLLHGQLAKRVDLLKTLKMALSHDLVEAIAGDVPFTEIGPRREQKNARELEAISQIRRLLGETVGREVHDLWHEFDARKSPESRFVTALDHLEVQIQHNLAPLETWEEDEFPLVYTKMDEHCAYDPFLNALCQSVKLDAERKWIDAGLDVQQIRTQALAEAGVLASVSLPGVPTIQEARIKRRSLAKRSSSLPRKTRKPGAGQEKLFRAEG